MLTGGLRPVLCGDEGKPGATCWPWAESHALAVPGLGPGDPGLGGPPRRPFRPRACPCTHPGCPSSHPVMCHPAPAVPGVSEPRACQPAVSSLSLQVQWRRSLSVHLHSRPALQTEAVPRHADCSWASQPALSWGVPKECMGLVVLIVTACSVQSLSRVQLFATP